MAAGIAYCLMAKKRVLWGLVMMTLATVSTIFSWILGDPNLPNHFVVLGGTLGLVAGAIATVSGDY